MQPGALTSGLIAITMLIGDPSAFISPAVGSLVVLVRCQGGLLLAADSRLTDPLTGTYRDGISKPFTSAPFAWFLTGKSGAIAYDADTHRELTRVDLYEVMNAVAARGNASNAVEMATRMASQVARTLTQFYAKHSLPVGQSGSGFALIGVVRHSNELALARLKVGQDGRSLEYEGIPVERIPRLGVFGNDRVYNAMKRGDSKVERLARDLPFRRVWDSEQDPLQADALAFAKWLIEVTSQNDRLFGRSDHPVGGPPSILFVTAQGSRWLTRPGR